ncbi:DUF2971 domain-containing protein [Colwellia sp. 6_MG-2023]|uniref:DUF2971 domain-containing protein n=1 Tax=Colwellia sp. 6_MG-2023 TaxID=3062676 RepID=UPI0026E3A264|nr:DUF2971 domain-containing protein [Colwellia sp. 6_MG-2023]MDO6487120.1 DUF2971 domain-containing protein [Colwellia sp. 6_MG-2023]
MIISPLLNISDELADDTVLYRTIDFFGATSIISNQSFMFTRADAFSDPNEGIERLLLQLEAGPIGCGGMGWTDSLTAKEHHERIKKSYYISCWSRNPESVAMWSLYSQDYCSVRIATTVGKLKQVVNNLLDKYCLRNLSESDIGQKKIVSVEGGIKPVTYACLHNLSSKVSRRLKAYKRIEARYLRKGIDKPTLDEVNPRYWEREEQRNIKELQTNCNLKDNSFKHEDEVRLSVRLAEANCDDNLLKLREYYDPNNKYHSIMKRRLKSHEFGIKLASFDREYVKCPENLVSSVALDPRCPPHKALFIKNWFREQNIPIIESMCFGYLPNYFDVFPEK